MVVAPYTYLVTGGTGFIGTAVVRRLVQDGAAVRVVDNDIRGCSSRLADLNGHVEIISCDVRDTEALSRAAKGCSSILHLAALNGTANFYERPELVLDIGLRGMLAALQAAARNGIDEFILASSSEAYHRPSTIPTPEEVPLTIPDPWNPRYSYAASKLISEIMLANYHGDLIRRAIIFRPHNVYGPDMGWEHVIPQFVVRAHERAARQASGPLEFPLQGDGSQTRSFIYIDDFVEAFMLVLSRGKHRTVYHIGTEHEVRIADVARLVGRHIGRDLALQPGESPKGAPERRCPDTRRLRGLGFTPRVALEDGVGETVRWYVDNIDSRSIGAGPG